MQEKIDRIVKMTKTATKPQNKAAIKLLDDWFDGEPTEPTPEPEPFKIGHHEPYSILPTLEECKELLEELG